MARINAADIKVGMVLAGDLYGPRGRFLVPGGTVLDEKHLKVIKAWGVAEADIEGVTREDAAAMAAADIDPEHAAEAERIVDILFTRMDAGHEAVAELKRLCAFRISESLGRGEAPRDVWTPNPEHAFDPQELKAEREPKISPFALVRKQLELVSLPDVYFHIVEVLESPYSSSSSVAEVVGKDPSLSAKLLRLVNSAFYGFPSKIETIDRAVCIIGANDLNTLALGVSVINSFADIPPDIIDVRDFWLHSIACGVTARFLASQKPGLAEERFFTAGLLHDIGRLLIIKGLAPEFAKAMFFSRAAKVPSYMAEKAVIGFDHAVVGGFLFKEWKFPAALERAVRFHHNPMAAVNPLDPAVIHVADIIATALRLGRGGSCFLPPLRPQAWDALGLSPGILKTVFEQADRQAAEIERAFFGSGP